MAKCVRVIGQGVPFRLSDDDAFEIVHKDHDGEYCPKSFWKDWNATYKRESGYAEIVQRGKYRHLVAVASLGGPLL